MPSANITATLDSDQPGPTPVANGLMRERVKLVGAATAAGDTGTYTAQFVRPLRVIGAAVSASVSGQSVTFTAIAALSSSTTYVEIEGYA